MPAITLNRFHLFLVATLFALTALGGCSKEISDRDIRFVTIAELATYLREPEPGVALIDARSEAQFRESALPGAIHVPLQSISTNHANPRLEGYRRYIVYGETPGDARSIALTKRLLSLGRRAVLLEEGAAVWRNRGLPLASDVSDSNTESNAP